VKRLIRSSSAAAWVLGAGIALSLLVWWLTGLAIQRQERAAFENTAQVSAGLIERRFERYADLLHGIQGLFGHYRGVSRLQFHQYVDALDLPRRFPGLQSLQFIQRVKSAEKDQFVSLVRADRSLQAEGYPDFLVKTTAERPEYWVIKYVEPMRGNETAFGLDLHTREEPRRAMERARDSGEAVMTGRYTLVQDKTRSVGLVVYLPVYEFPRARRTVQQRRDELVGFVNVVFRVSDVFAGVIDDRLSAGIGFSINDVGPTSAPPEEPSAHNLLVGLMQKPELEALARSGKGYSHKIVTPIAGRNWYMEFHSGQRSPSPWLTPLPLLTVAAGLVVSLLLYLMLLTWSRSREAAISMADKATNDLRAQLNFNQQLIESLPNPVFFKDNEGRYLGCNRAFEEYTGRRKDEIVGKLPHDIASKETADIYVAADRELLERQGVQHYELTVQYPRFPTPRHVQYRKGTFTDANGSVAGIVGVIIDLTAEKNAAQALQDKTEEIESILESSPLAIIARDLNSVIRTWNPAAEKLFGWRAEEVIGTSASIVPAHLREVTRAQRKRAEAGELIQIEETERLHRDGRVIDVSVTVAPVYGARGQVMGTMVIIADITRRKRAEMALRKNETQLRLALESADMATWHWDLTEQTLVSSTGFGALFGLAPDAAFAGYRDFKRAVHPDDWRLVHAAVRNAIRHSDDFDLQMRVVWPDATVHWVAADGQVIRDPEGKAVALIGVAMDVTERKLSEQRISHMAQHDALTGLPNRLLLRDRIGQAIAQANRNKTQLAVLFLDLDRFKNINDSMGHEAGDKLLQTVARRIVTCLREGDTVSRLGGDEFVIVLPDVGDSVAAATVATKVLEVLGHSFHIQGQDVHAGASIGVAMYPADGADADTLMRNADAAMYYAKDSGRANYQFFTQHLNVAAQQRVTIESELRRGLERGEFTLAYQPVFATGSGELVSMEALLRWNHPERGLVPPGEFIAVAEEAGLIHGLGEWVLDEACAQMKRWHDAGHPLRVSVNVSAQQLRRKGFHEKLRDILVKHETSPRLLELEITESLIVEDSGEALKTLNLINQLGVRLAVDDFGTGYSGLAYLKRFPIDTVKIDQSFIRDVSDDPDDAAIVRAIVGMARSLKLSVVAEGVETAEQLAFLRSLGCDLVQGYFLGRPMSPEGMAGLLAKSDRSDPGRQHAQGG
jgi:diguanylate cyclase (GGDEF)-like protein/PAS domain S-box-containing protein